MLKAQQRPQMGRKAQRGMELLGDLETRELVVLFVRNRADVLEELASS